MEKHDWSDIIVFFVLLFVFFLGTIFVLVFMLPLTVTAIVFNFTSRNIKKIIVFVTALIFFFILLGAAPVQAKEKPMPITYLVFYKPILPEKIIPVLAKKIFFI